MADFNRNKPDDGIFEDTSDEVVEIVLTFRDDFQVTYERNTDNGLKFGQVIKYLTNGVRLAFFQKQKSDEEKYKSRHRIIIPLGNEKALEAKVNLLTVSIDTYAYYVGKFKEISFFTDPVRNTIKRECVFKIGYYKDKIGTSNSKFKDLFKDIEKLEIPTVDVNKEKDRQIWHKYVVALKKLVRQKEQVWKILKISQPYTDKDSSNVERNNYIDIYINEKDLMYQYEKEIESLFSDEELEDYGVREDKAFIEFSNYRELSQEELNKQIELSNEYFYDLSLNSPMHYLSGELEFKFVDDISKEEILNDLKKDILNEYQIDLKINNDGLTNLSEEDFPHLQKIVKDNYDFLIDVKKDSTMVLNVGFENINDFNFIQSAVEDRLKKKGLNRVKIFFEAPKYLIVELSSHVPCDIFSDLDLVLDKTISRFGTTRRRSLIEIDGLEIKDNVYQIINTQNWKCQQLLDEIKQVNSDSTFKWLPTLYYFKVNPKKDIERLKNFKTDADLLGKTSFEITTLRLIVSAEDQEDYLKQLDRIKTLYPKVSIEKKSFKPSFYVKFKTDIESQRLDTISKIQNTIRKSKLSKIEYDILKNHTRVLFRYYFSNEEDRENFKTIFTEACVPYLNVLKYSFENNLGRTIYEFIKNEKLVEEEEKETRKNIFLATFVYLNPEQKKRLEDKIAKHGELASFTEGIQIGKLIRKDKNKLKFLISETFDSLINAPLDKRLEFKELIEGYIKPIFPGDITNIDRMIRAMEKVVNPGGLSQYFFSRADKPYRIGYPVNRNLPNFLFDPNEARLYSEDIEKEIQHILSNLNEPRLKNQPRQLSSVAKALLAKDLALIQGPPGSGKTTVIAEIIWQTLLRDSEARILITSQTNLAVDNALERLKGKKLVRPIRIGNPEKFEDEGKVYSNERIKTWIQSKNKSKEELSNSDNAVSNWIKNISTRDIDEKFNKPVTKWLKGLEECDQLIKVKFSNAYYKNINVFAATCSECGSRNFADIYQSIFQTSDEQKAEPEFDLVIMDEASKATPPELVLPLTLGKKVVIIGDHKQLPPMIDEKEFGEALDAVGAKQLVEDWTLNDYKVSQFEKLFKNAPEKLVASLDTQFRMHKQIMDCISQFYKDQAELMEGLKCGIEGEMDIPDLLVPASRWHGFLSAPFIEPKDHAIWVNVESEERKVGTSYENEGEVKAILTILKVLTKAEGFQNYQIAFKKAEDKEIGIITYYMPQMQRIRKTLYSHFGKAEWRTFENHKFENEYQIPFRINTVDRFQGMERNIIIVSTVRSNKQIREENGKDIVYSNTTYPLCLGFARELQRINVGFSRAKRLLIVVGNEKHFMRKSEYADAIQIMHRVDILQLQNLINR